MVVPSFLRASVTFGHGIADKETYARVLEQKLRHRFRSQRLNVEVLNFGVPAFNITNIVSSFVEKRSDCCNSPQSSRKEPRGKYAR